MHNVTESDRRFCDDFEAGRVLPNEFDHRGHLRLAYLYLATQGPDLAASIFRESLLRYLDHHQIDRAKYHETMTQGWLRATWYFMQHAGKTAGSEDFLNRSAALLDTGAMLTHYTKRVLFSERARHTYVAPDLEIIPTAWSGPAAALADA